MDDESFRQILQLFDLSWIGYRKVRKGVKRRIARHMHHYGCRGISEYLRVLRSEPDAAGEARRLLTVSISRFFRDLRLWEVMREFLIPALVQRSKLSGRRSVRVWSAGCSCGEEVYSIRILWDELQHRFSDMPPIEIWATDKNPEVLEKAQMGVYPPSSLRNVPSSMLEDYFSRASKRFLIHEEIKEGIHWLLHDFISEKPPDTNFDMLFLRNNLLTYYEPPVRIPAFVQILEALSAGGFLIIGNNEEISIEGLPLRQHPQYRCILEKIGEKD